MFASALAARKFRKIPNIGTIGIVHDYHPCYGADHSEECQQAVKMAKYVFNDYVLSLALAGELPEEFITVLKKKYDLSFIKDGHKEIFRTGKVDFLGLNYYTKSDIIPYQKGETTFQENNTGKRGITKHIVIKDMFERIEDPNGKFTEWDMEIFPQGLYDSILEVTSKYHVPIYITENGVGLHEKIEDQEIAADDRIDFMKAHIAAMLKAKAEGADVRGYYAWSTFDVYSWVNGYEKRYGLVYIDFENKLKRIPKKSYYWYQNFIKKYQE